MSLPFAKAKHQHGDEEEVAVQKSEGRRWVKRWRGIEMGFKIQTRTITRKWRPQLQVKEVASKAAFAPEGMPYPDEYEETETTKSVMFCLTPPTDPPSDPPRAQ